MAKQISPEEQLFKVIKAGSQTAQVAASAISPPASSAGSLKLKQSPASMNAAPSMSNARGGASADPIVLPEVLPEAESNAKTVSSAPSSQSGFFKGAVQSLTALHVSGTQYFAVFRRIEVINRVLAIFLIVLLCGFVYTFVFSRTSMKKTMRNLARPPVRVSKPLNHEAFLSPEEYVKISRQRDIFSYEQHAAAEDSTIAEKSTALQAKTDLHLVGIYFSEQPEVIIEDKAEKKTYFLKEGENIKGIKVKSIRQDRVILESDGMDWELM
ncbi:MAG: type II secretion system protein N [Verrucomicrobiota bacterium]